MSSESGKRDPVEVLGEEFLRKRRRGEDPKIHQYIAAHRQYAEQISALFPAMIAMEDLKAIKNQSADRPIRLHIDRLERLGDFRIIREIGHGGMGIVYEAEQESLRRRVAVKVFPKQAIGDSNQLKRFQREAETAGGLHHTNIVPVFGVGQQDRLHYFVMQFIDGVSLDAVIGGMASLDSDFRSNDYIQHAFDVQHNARKLSRLGSSETGCDLVADNGSVVELHESDVVGEATTRREANGFGKQHWRRIAEIGIQVAEALEYAHCRGVMHRDIKPSNLILGSDGRVWVTDFGLAVTHEHEQERLSRSGDVVGTLRYMSPEQLSGRSDQRSDIYGLGLTLYELMTLRPAFEGQSRGSLIRKVSNSDLPAPRSLCREIPRDLETVILKAIARSPESRYKSAEDFAEDLRRFRNDQPIRARRIGPAERVGRWSRRNPSLAGMSLALTLIVVFSFVAVSWNWRQAIQEKKNAENEGARAENNLTLALGSMDRLLERFESDWMSHPVAPESAASDSEPQWRFVASDLSAAVWEEALEFYDQFAEQNANSPKLDRDTAKAYRRAGDILERLGRYSDAEQAYRRCADTLEKLIDRSGDDADLIADSAAVLNRLALVLHRVYRSEEAKVELDRAKFLLMSQLTRNQSSLRCTYELALTNSHLGLVLWRMHQGEDSTQQHRRAILLLEGLAEENPFAAKYRHSLAQALRNYYPIAVACKQGVYANEIHAEAESILEQLVIDFPSVPDYRCELSEMLTRAPEGGGSSTAHRRHQINRAVQLADELSREFQSIPRYQTALARSLTVQASLARVSDADYANQIHLRAIDLLRRLCARFPDVAAYRALLAGALREHGITLAKMEHLEEAIGALEQAVAEQTAFLDTRPKSVFGRRAMSHHLRILADTRDRSDQGDLAVEARAHANSFWRQRPSEE
jgi:serine/threonine protein kinase